jgi:hypothetical protein
MPDRETTPIWKRPLRPIYWGYRFATSPMRAVPTFIIIGAQKAGTTSLFRYLRSHPHVSAARGKEVHYFDFNYAKGLLWYRASFAVRPWLWVLGKLRGHRIESGEASPYYIFHPHAAKRIAETIPDAKLILLVRDPVERAYSHYKHSCRANLDPLPFEEAIQHEEARIGEELAQARADEAHAGERRANLPIYSYKTRGCYAEQLKCWYDVFPREQVLVLSSEQLFEDPETTYTRALKFLDLPKADYPSFDKHNASNSKAPMSPEARAELEQYFAPHNQELTELLGEDFGWGT